MVLNQGFYKRFRSRAFRLGFGFQAVWGRASEKGHSVGEGLRGIFIDGDGQITLWMSSRT